MANGTSKAHEMYAEELKVSWMTRISGSHFGGSSGSHLQTKLSGCDPDF